MLFRRISATVVVDVVRRLSDRIPSGSRRVLSVRLPGAGDGRSRERADVLSRGNRLVGESGNVEALRNRILEVAQVTRREVIQRDSTAKRTYDDSTLVAPERTRPAMPEGSASARTAGVNTVLPRVRRVRALTPFHCCDSTTLDQPFEIA